MYLNIPFNRKLNRWLNKSKTGYESIDLNKYSIQLQRFINIYQQKQIILEIEFIWTIQFQKKKKKEYPVL